MPGPDLENLNCDLTFSRDLVLLGGGVPNPQFAERKTKDEEEATSLGVCYHLRGCGPGEGHMTLTTPGTIKPGPTTDCVHPSLLPLTGKLACPTAAPPRHGLG